MDGDLKNKIIVVDEAPMPLQSDKHKEVLRNKIKKLMDDWREKGECQRQKLEKL